MLQVKKNMNSNGETSISTDGRRVHRIDINRIPRQPLYFQLCLGMRNQGRPRLRLKDVAKREHEMERHRSRWQEKANDRPTIPTRRTYQTFLKPRTVSVEPTDCHVDDILGRSNHL